MKARTRKHKQNIRFTVEVRDKNLEDNRLQGLIWRLPNSITKRYIRTLGRIFADPIEAMIRPNCSVPY